MEDMNLQKYSDNKALLTLTVVYAVSAFFAFNIHVLSIMKILTLLTGNFLIDAFFSTILAPIFLLFYIPFRRKYRLLNFLTFCYLIVFTISTISQFKVILPFLQSQQWQHIRSVVGEGFILFVLALVGYFKSYKQNPEWLFIFGMMSLAVCIILVPFALSYNGISWLHFMD